MLDIKFMRMKKLFLLVILLRVGVVNAADLYVNNSGQAGTYTTISAAITAAAANDRIFVSPYGVYTENLTIAKSLTLTSAVANTRFSVVGSLTVTSAANQDVVIIGGEFSGGVTGNTGTATLTTKGNLTVSDCITAGINSGDFIKTKILFSTISSTGTVFIRNGYIVGSQIGGDINISDGPNSGVGDTILIIANKISYGITWANNDNYFLIANNFISQGYIYIGLFQFNSIIKNTIRNNTVLNACGFATSCGYGKCLKLVGFVNANMSNIEIYNNIFQDETGSYTGDVGCGQATCFAFTGSAKFFYNIGEGVSGIVGNINNAGGLVTNGLGESVDAKVVNQGSPALQYYDIDLTRNDMGTFGGPYSIDNYWNTATGRARVYDLTMPFEIWNGSTPSIKAEGTHIK